jgi:hypothetical protein
MPGFLETVQAAWDQLVNTQDAILRMRVKFLRTAKALKLWKRQNLDNLALRLAIANEVLLLLDTAQEQRSLTTEELQFQKYLKAKSVGLAAIQRARTRQHSRLTWLRKGDACTRLCMLHENNRKKKLHIPSLRTSTGVTTNHIQKEAAIYDHFVRLLGKTPERTRCLNCDNLGYSPHDLTELEAPFEENEIKSTISQLPAEKSPGPDGFIGIIL